MGNSQPPGGNSQPPGANLGNVGVGSGSIRAAALGDDQDGGQGGPGPTRKRKERKGHPVGIDTLLTPLGLTQIEAVRRTVQRNPGTFLGGPKINDLTIIPLITEEAARQYPDLFQVGSRVSPSTSKNYFINARFYQNVRQDFEKAINKGELSKHPLYKNFFVLTEPVRVAYFPQGIEDPMFNDVAHGENGLSPAQMLAQAHPGREALFGVAIQDEVAE